MKGYEWLLGFGVVLAASARLGAAGDWPQWRGPGRDGVAAGATLPERLPTKLKIVWQKEVGEGYSGPVVAEGKLVVFARQGENEAVWCLNAADGKELWKDEYPAPYTPASVAARHGKGPFATPTIAGGKVLTFGISGTLSCYGLESGRLEWRQDFKKQFKRTYPSWGASCSPLAEGGLCILAVGAKEEGGLAAFHPATGKMAWEQGADSAAYSSPVAASLAGQRQVVALMERHLLAVEPKGGKVLWRVPFEVQYEQNSFTPIVFEDKVIVSGWNQAIRAYRITAREGELSAVEAWRNPREAFYMNTPVLVGRHLYGLADRGRGMLVCLSAEDGRTLWSSEGGLGQYASIVAAGDKVLVLTAGGALLLVAADPVRYNELGRVSLSNDSYWAHLAAVGGRVYAREKSSLTCFDLGGE